MTSFMSLDGETSYLRLKDVAITCKLMRRSLSIGGMAETWKKLKTSNAFSSFIVC